MLRWFIVNVLLIKKLDLILKLQVPRQVSWIEIKSVSLRMDERTLAFPDAVTTRGQKHLRALMEARARGERAILVFVIMRATDISSDEVAQQFRPAYEIDSVYNDFLNRRFVVA